MNLRRLLETVKYREAWTAVVHGISKGYTWLSNWTTTHILLLLSHFSRVWLFVTPWSVAYQAPLSLEFSRQYWNGLPFSSPGCFPNPGIEPGSPELWADSLPSEPPGRPLLLVILVTLSPIWGQRPCQLPALSSVLGTLRSSLCLLN